MQSFDDPGRAIRVAVAATFAIALEGNPTTGYTWQAAVQAGFLELMSREFEPTTGGVGAGGREVFRFRALATGQTQIDFTYRRPWDKKAHDSVRFRVRIV